jgi:hypothetical protein
VQVLLALPLFIGWVLSAISMTADSRRRAWHDLASGCEMTKVASMNFGRLTRDAPEAMP